MAELILPPEKKIVPSTDMDLNDLQDYSDLLGLFKLENKPMNLRLHFQFQPMFKFVQPRRTCWVCARQLGKTFSAGSSVILRCGTKPNFNTLIVLPRADQMTRVHNTILKPLFNSMTDKNIFIDGNEVNKFSVKSFKNSSIIFQEYAFINADRVRSCTGVSCLWVDELADIEYDFLPILGETMSASKFYGFYVLTGTPKTTDGTAGVTWDQSSQAEWAIPCKACRKENIPDVQHDLIKMIGKTTVCCAKCGKDVDARNGYYVHGIPSRRDTFAGYHVSQVVHPLHYAFPNKWRELQHKMNTWTKTKFYNEVLGVPCDESVKLLSLKDLVDASNGLPINKNKTRELRPKYEGYVMGVDWSGGGELEESFTSVAIVGFRPGTDVLDCIYAERFNLGLQPEEEVKLLLEYINSWGVLYMAHDYGGAGHLRESMMRQAGLPEHQIIPFTYVGPTNKNVITYNPPRAGVRYSYSMEKARSLAIIAAMIKANKITLPKFDPNEERQVCKDLLNLIEMPKELPRGNTMYLIGKRAKSPDDFAHALNYACSAIWYTRQQYPNLAACEKFNTSAEALAQINPEGRFWGTGNK